MQQCIPKTPVRGFHATDNFRPSEMTAWRAWALGNTTLICESWEAPFANINTKFQKWGANLQLSKWFISIKSAANFITKLGGIFFFFLSVVLFTLKHSLIQIYMVGMGFRFTVDLGKTSLKINVCTDFCNSQKYSVNSHTNTS